MLSKNVFLPTITLNKKKTMNNGKKKLVAFKKCMINRQYGKISQIFD